MIRFLLDSSALWRLLREPRLRSAWSEAITAGVVGSCQPQRVEFRRSARNAMEYDEMTEMFDALYPDVPVPKYAWQWVEAAQYRLLRAGAHRGVSTVDLLIAGTAASRGLVILHDDQDFVTTARHVSDVNERAVRDRPGS